MAQNHRADLPEEGSEKGDVERLLRWYYGPPREEQPLASAAWEVVRAQLERVQTAHDHQHRGPGGSLCLVL